MDSAYRGSNQVNSPNPASWHSKHFQNSICAANHIRWLKKKHNKNNSCLTELYNPYTHTQLSLNGHMSNRFTVVQHYKMKFGGIAVTSLTC